MKSIRSVITLTSSIATALAAGNVLAFPNGTTTTHASFDHPALLCSSPAQTPVLPELGRSWSVEFLPDTPLASIADQDSPAEYSNAHVTIRLSSSGPNVLIGRESGRFIVSDLNGITLSAGICSLQGSSALSV